MTSVVYSLRRIAYTKVEEQMVYDISNLVSSIGGIVGLWLGAGFMGLLEAAIFLPTVFLRYSVGRLPGKTRVENDATRLTEIEAELSLLKAKLKSMETLSERVGTLEHLLELEVKF